MNIRMFFPRCEISFRPVSRLPTSTRRTTMLLRGTCWIFILVMGFGRYGPSYAMADTALETVAKSNTDFSSAMFRVFTTKGAADDQNLIFSPYSISAVMAMVKLGANRKTAVDIRNAMKFPQWDDTIVNGYKELLEMVQGTEDFTMETVNKIYAMTGFKLNDTFTSKINKYFNATIDQLDFSDTVGAAREINEFVQKVTRDKIKDIVNPDQFNHLTKLVLLNAIYFKGKWKYQFKKDDTEDKDFHIGNGQRVKVPMMNIQTGLHYAKIPDLDARAVALPYKGDRLVMIILLPNQIDGMKGLEDTLSKSSFNLNDISKKLDLTLVNLKLPRFKLECTIDLNGPLVKLGAGSIFSPGLADFSNIPEDGGVRLSVSKAVQKAFIEVSEEGGEAYGQSKRIPPPVIYMDMDHPFISIIAYQLDVDCSYGDADYGAVFHWGRCHEYEIIFMSKVSNPLVSEGSISISSSGPIMVTSNMVILVIVTTAVKMIM